MSRPERIAWLLLAVAVLLPRNAEGEWTIWPDFVPPGELALDQSQDSGTETVLCSGQQGKGVGQTFRPASTHLHRIDVRVRNRGDERPARIRVWKWQGSRAVTEESPALFDDVIGMAGIRDTWHTRSTFPDLRVEPGALYYFRLDAEGRDIFELRASRDGHDAYPRGSLVGRHLDDRAGNDLWFRIWARSETATGPGDSTSPARAPHATPITWSSPSARTTGVTASDYERRVEAFTRRLREIQAASCGANDDRRAFLESLLYRLSCSRSACREELARNALDRLRRFLQWQHCDFSGVDPDACASRCEAATPPHFEDLETALGAYENLVGSPSWDPELATALRATLSQMATDLWPARQLGTGSRALVGASAFLRAAKVVPDAPGASAWRAHAEAVWSDFRRHLDFQGGSSLYVTAAWPAVLQLAEEMGESDSLWHEPRFRALVDRQFDEVAPVGVLPGYGDTAGWGTDSPALVWLFEEAARQTREGRYRWLAHQIFRYNGDRVRDAPPRDDSWGPKMHHLARARLTAARWKGEPERPAPLVEKPVVRSGRAPDVWWDLPDDRRIGQTFEHPSGSVARIDVKIEGTGADHVRIRIWPWRGDVEATKSGEPIHSARLEPNGDGTFAAWPLLPSGRPASLYFELDGGGADVRVGGLSDDPYVDGRAIGPMVDGGADLWFETFAAEGLGSVVTHRLASDELPVSEWKDPVHAHRFTDDRVPDKLVLRSGTGPEDLFALVNLLSGYRHGRPSLGSFSTIIDQGTVILSETSFPYWEYTRRAEEGNVAMVRRHRGGALGVPDKSVQVVRFVDTPNVTVAWLRFGDMEGAGVAQERRIYFVKNRFIWVRDRFDLPPHVLVTVGTVWHPDLVLPSIEGQPGHRIAYPNPLQNVWPVFNAPRLARLWMPAHAGTVEADEIMPEHAASPRCSRLASGRGPVPADCRISPAHALHRSWTGSSGEGRRVWIDTILVPEGPDESTELQSLLTNESEIGLAVRLHGEKWLLLDNPERRSVDAGGIRTDALYTLLRSEPAGTPYIHAAEATRLLGLGWSLESETPSSTERGGFSP